MIDITKLNQQTKLIRRVDSGDKFLYLRTGMGRSYAPAEGTHYYATIREGGRREIVQVTGASGDMLTVERGLDGTTAGSFSPGACLSIEWNPAQLCEFVTSCVQGEKPVMSPGTYCLECNTCIDVDAYGRITRIDGVERC